MSLPTFIIAGVPRAATTSLAAYLAAHPQLFMSAQKELHFFNSRYDRGLDWYASQFEGAGPALHRGEARRRRPTSSVPTRSTGWRRRSRGPR